MKRNYLLLTTCLIFSFFSSFAQDLLHCGTDKMRHEMVQQNPELREGIAIAYEQLSTYTEWFKQQPALREGTTYIIPVVFHIIHNYGDENIGDAQIYDAVKQVNTQMRKRNADTTDIVSPFKALAADAEIEIRLAQLDPQGNCTSGITRTVSDLTYIGDHQVKSLIQWPPDQYLNIYVCDAAAGLAGHALLPADAAAAPEWDGIVMQHSYVGTIGTSDYFRRTVLTHEIGHYFNLQHIWGGNNVPDYFYLTVAQAGNCEYDDEVEDTPLTIGWQTCNLSGTTCGTLDNVQNYMEYSYCARMFTEGQKTRMHACLNSPVAGRNNLWQPGNLLATGTDDATYYLCAANFESDKKIICAGETVEFSDVSYHGIEQRDWTFEGGTASSYTDSLIEVTYTSPGVYGVTLEVGNGTETEIITKEEYITVLPAQGAYSGMHESFEHVDPFFERWVRIPTEAPVNWDFTPVGFESSTSFYINNFEAGAWEYTFRSKPVDASVLSDLAVTFDYAYAQRETGNNDLLQIAVSNDCGNTWATRKVFYGASTLKTVDAAISEEAFTPVDETQWKSGAVTNINASYLVDNLMIRFRFIGDGGNNLYIDNIRIAHPDALQVEEKMTGELSVYPNPVTDQLTVIREMETGKSFLLRIVDLSGKVVYEEESMQQKTTIFTGNLNQGYYVLHVDGKTVPFVKLK